MARDAVRTVDPLAPLLRSSLPVLTAATGDQKKTRAQEPDE
jgi:hypothetical protein